MNKTKLDNIFSQYVRLKNADSNGIVSCISCGKPIHWKQADAGHFVNRKHMSLRFSDINVQPQCRACNRFDEGNLPGFGLGLQRKYGEDVIKRLLAVKNQTVKFGQFEIDEMTKHYKGLVKELLIEKV